MSDEAYDALSVEDGWEERGWAVDRCDTYPIGWHLQKEAEIRGCLIVAFPPKQPGRQVEQVVRDILAESMTPPVTPQEDEAWSALERDRGWKASSDA